MHFIIDLAFILLSGSVAAQQAAVDESTAVQKCYTPKVWAYCADQTGNALPPICVDPEESNLDSSKPKPCPSSCVCDKPVPNPGTGSQGALDTWPGRSYPLPRVSPWGETTEEPAAVEKDLIKTTHFESSYDPSYTLAEYPEDAEQVLQQSPKDESQIYELNPEPGVSLPAGNPPNLDDLPKSNNEMFLLKPDPNQNRPVPSSQEQTPPTSEPNELTYPQATGSDFLP